MAGKRQHYITAHLLSGFGTRQGKATRTYLYRKATPVVRTSVQNIACESYFYSKEYPGSLDDKITDYEKGLVATIDSFRARKPFDCLPSDQVAEVLVHFVIRGAFVREHMAECVRGLLRAVETTPSVLPLTEQELFDSINQSFSRRLHLPLVAVKPISQLVKWWLTKTDKGKVVLKKSVNDAFQGLMPEITSLDFDAMVVDAQKKILDDILSKPDPKHETAMKRALGGLHWRVLPFTNAILPDCVSISLNNGLWRQTSIWGNGGVEAQAVVFPIGAERVCVGTESTQTAGSTVPPWMKDYDDSAARLSRTYFVAKSPVHAALHTSIGIDADKLAQELVGGSFSRNNKTDENLADLIRATGNPSNATK